MRLLGRYARRPPDHYGAGPRHVVGPGLGEHEEAVQGVVGDEMFQIFAIGGAGKQNLAGKKEMLDKFSPLALKAYQRL